MIWRVDYIVGNCHKSKYVVAVDAPHAIKKARVKNIEDLEPRLPDMRLPNPPEVKK